MVTGGWFVPYPPGVSPTPSLAKGGEGHQDITSGGVALAAYKHADGKKLDGRRVLVDVERGRTIKGWRSRRLGGGLGGTRKGGPEVNTKYSGREESMRDDRSRSRSPRRRRRSRSRSRDRVRRRSRSPVRERRRSRDRDRERERERGDRDRERDMDMGRKRSRRSRSRERKPRSRSRDRAKRSRRSRSRDHIKRERNADREEKPNVGDIPLGEPQPEGETFIVMDPSQIKAEPVKAGYDKYVGEAPPDDEYQDNGGYQGNGQEAYNGDGEEGRE